MKKAKSVKGCDYAVDKEEYDKAKDKKAIGAYKKGGLALKLKDSEVNEGYSKKPKVKPQKKLRKVVHGQKESAY